MNKEYINATTHILHCDALYYINRKKYKTVCAELLFTSHFQQNGHDFFMEFVIFA